VQSTSYEAPYHVIFSDFLSLPPSEVQNIPQHTVFKEPSLSLFG